MLRRLRRLWHKAFGRTLCVCGKPATGFGCTLRGKILKSQGKDARTVYYFDDPVPLCESCIKEFQCHSH